MKKVFLILILGLFLVSFASAGWDSSLSVGLQGYFSLNETTSTYKNYATGMSSYTLADNGLGARNHDGAMDISGYSAYADGDGSASNTDGTYLAYASTIANYPLTACIWFNSTGTGDQVIMGKNFQNGQMIFELMYKAGTDQVRARSNRLSGTSELTSTKTIPANTWAFYCMISNSTGIYNYINGTLDGTVANSNNLLAQPAYDFSIGAGYYDVGSGRTKWGDFTGELDEAMVWNRSLADTEILGIFNSYNPATREGGLTPWATDLGITISQEYPDGAEIFTTNKVNFSSNVSDVDAVGIQNVTINIWNTDTDTLNYSNTNTSTISGIYNWNLTILDGNYNWTVIAYDDADLLYESLTREFEVDTSPNVTINSPTNGSIVISSGNNITFEFNVTGDSIGEVEFYLDGVLNGTISTGVSGGYSLYRLVSNGAHNWSIKGIGDGGGINQSTTYFFSAFNYIKINVLNYYQEHLDQIRINCSAIGFEVNTTSPYITELSTFTEEEYEPINCTFTDLELYNTINTTEINFSETMFEYNVTLDRKELILNYFHYNGSSVNVTGYYSDGNLTANFTQSNSTFILQELMQGKVRVQFGYNSTILNYTQYYEYENDWISHTIENLTVIENADTSAYIKVVDESGNPIDDVLVRVAYSLPQIGGTYKEMGQRFTGSEGNSGMTSFYFRTDADVLLRFTKDGYEEKILTGDIGANTYTYSSPLTIILRKTELSVYKGVFLRTYNYYHTNMSIIPVTIYAPSRDSVKFNTDYRISQGLGNLTITLNEFKRGITNLTRGVDYCSACVSNLTLTVYIDGGYWNTITIPYQARYEDSFLEPSGTDDTTERRIVWIALILISGVLGILLKSGDESLGAGAKGKYFFLIGCMIIAIIFYGSFQFLLIITLIWAGGTVLRRLIGE